MSDTPLDMKQYSPKVSIYANSRYCKSKSNRLPICALNFKYKVGEQNCAPTMS